LFHPFTSDSPDGQVQVIGGVRLLGVDNSNYQITEKQLRFVREQLAEGQPCVLLLHIPIYIPSLVDEVMQAWKAPIMMAAQGWEQAAMQKWKVREADPTTTAFHKLITEDEAGEAIIGIFCGHVHFAHEDVFRGDTKQYVTGPAFQGHGRIIRLLPKHG